MTYLVELILSIGRVILEQTQNLVSFWTSTGPLVQNWETLENSFLEQPYIVGLLTRNKCISYAFVN